MSMVTSQIWNLWILQKHKNLDISRTNHCFLFKEKDSLIAHQGLPYGKKYFGSGVNF